MPIDQLWLYYLWPFACGPAVAVLNYIYGFMPLDQLWLSWDPSNVRLIFFCILPRGSPIQWGWLFFTWGFVLRQSCSCRRQVLFVACSRANGMTLLVPKEILWGSRLISCSIRCDSWLLPWPIEFFFFKSLKLLVIKIKRYFCHVRGWKLQYKMSIVHAFKLLLQVRQNFFHLNLL